MSSVSAAGRARALAPASIVLLWLLTPAVPAARPAGGQAASQPARITSCEDLDALQALGFWVGEWDVHGPDPSAPPSFNRIEWLLDGCAVMEHWRAEPSGREGKSLFYYWPADGSVRQVWVTGDPTAPGGVKEKRLVDRGPGMVRFQGRLPIDGREVLDRTTLTRHADGSVRQHIEISADGGATWTTTFDARYVRRAPSAGGRAETEAEAAPVDPIPCGSQIAARRREWGGRGPLIRLAGSDPAAPRWAQPTDRVGTWLELRGQANDGPTLARVDAAGVTVVQWNQACQPIPSRHVAADPVPGDAGAGRMLDDDLAAFFAHHRRGIVYVWSPHMPLSVDGIPHVQAAADRAGVALLVLLDPRADRQFADRTARAHRLDLRTLTTFHSVELMYRGVLTHAPSALLFLNGAPAGQAVPGYQSADGYTQLIEDATRGR